MAAFVLGNGESRAGIEINDLLKKGDVYACNAVYRTHAVSVLVATDQAISDQIQNAGYALTHRFYTRRPLPTLGALPVPKPYYGFSSGPIAMALAAQDGHQTVYLLGFDMGPNLEGKFNNIYADTDFYKKKGSVPTYAGNWARQMRQIMQDFPRCTFTRIYGSTTAVIEDLEKQPNFARMDFATFAALINNAKDL